MKVTDQIWYGNKGPLGAVAFHTLAASQPKRDITKADWDAYLLKTPLVCTSVDNFAADKADFEKFCSFCHCCTADQKAQVDQLFQNIQGVKVK